MADEAAAPAIEIPPDLAERAKTYIRPDHIVTLDELSKLMPEQVPKDLTNRFAPKEEAKAG